MLYPVELWGRLLGTDSSRVAPSEKPKTKRGNLEVRELF